MDKYYIVDQSLLPDTFSKVIEARQLLDSGKIKSISEAVKKVGISRGSFYKYKDLVYETDEANWNRKAVISLMLDDQRGILSAVLKKFADSKASILTINQNIPIHKVASVVISLDLSTMEITIDELLQSIKDVDGTSKVNLVSIE
ncbi:ACT domain-containing protein [Fructilactobacillus sanfranciscensis]|uniref:ACT domain-containing protein n=1 Tax=Fructilactobacillus sanfranciscensis TaxID=1625 RepID=UPI000704ADC3|nr:ACT domain-containing protein [Fructilactobacillus sanfranciscensis]MCG7194795.1 ACT domain-containing protein [Fructilactobacillus sanfranciscensis]MCG7196319.1 ACT domain-containing protein [Fructilactobacillus sanfranciscensis]MDN4461905.1 ACT domain-containing protein [Fructilactobacillus sanfranciscensis]MVF16231.1 ACT domain-containing protein [Fructilactobacillus sanfranciscensis]NDR60459.1 ACT domain-containing protein [Fructilactobacillus sanfranciscensis]